jgi:3-oxoacyl-[acyl-carrier-protein] synthase III
VPDLHLHGSVFFQGLDLWSSACWVARELFGPRFPGLSLYVSAMCNTSLAGLELAAGVLSGRADHSHALITVADRFDSAAVDRWNIDSGVVLGDGAAAVVLGRDGGALRLLSVASFSVPDLEGLQRGTEPLHAASPAALKPIVLRERARGFFGLGTHTPASVVQSHVDGVRQVVATALDEAGSTMADMRWVVTPFVGRTAFRYGYAQPLGLDPDRTLHELGLRLGHLGGGDHLFALDHLVRETGLRAGDRVLLIGVGSGFTFSAAVLEAA